VFAALGIGLLLLDEQHRVCLVNDLLAQSLGLDREAVVGAPVERVLPNAWVQALGAGLAGGEAKRSKPRGPRGLPQHLTLVLPDGAAREYSVEVRRLDANPLLLVAVRPLDQAGDATHRGRELVGSDLAETPSPLSPREREVLSWIAEGSSTKGIAERLGIAPTTVETYRRQIMSKLQLRTIAELTKYAVREKLTPP
jgi:DNA-binding CsgD family transcriptional regulator